MIQGIPQHFQQHECSTTNTTRTLAIAATTQAQSSFFLPLPPTNDAEDHDQDTNMTEDNNKMDSKNDHNNYQTTTHPHTAYLLPDLIAVFVRSWDRYLQ